MGEESYRCFPRSAAPERGITVFGFPNLFCLDGPNVYHARVAAEMERMVWRHPRVHSDDNDDTGRVVTNAPWRLLDDWRMTRRPEPDDDVLVRVGARTGEGRGESR